MSSNQSSKEQRIKSLLGFALRARKINFGETLLSSIPHRKVHLVLVADDMLEGSLKKVNDKCNYYHVPIHKFLTKEELGDLLHKSSISAIGVLEPHIAQQILTLLKEVN